MRPCPALTVSSAVTDKVPRFRLWPACSEWECDTPGRSPVGPTAPCSNSQERERDRKKMREQPKALRRLRGGEAEAAAEAMLRGSGGSPAAAKPRRPRPPSPPAPSRRARATIAAPESKNASVLEDPVVSSVEGASFTFEFKRGPKRAKKAMPPAEARRGKENSREGLPNKPNVVPAKTPAAKEGPKEVEFTHCAPGIVARLMGLDTVPRPKKALDRCQSDIQSTMQRRLYGGVQEVARTSYEDQPCNSSVGELPELKDVFEVTEMENMAMRMALQSGNDMPRPRSNEADLEFVRQKFLDAKRLSTDEGHRNSKEFSEALEILHSKKDVFLEILQERSTVLSGFPGHILGHSGLQCSPHTSNAAVTQLFEQDNLRSMQVERGGRFHVAEQSEDPLPSMHLKKTSAVPLEHLAQNRSKSKTSGRRSQIVVLKPNLGRECSTPVMSSQETSQFGQWSDAQLLKPTCRDMYRQDVVHSMAPSNVQVLEPGDTPEQKVRKQTPKRGSCRKPSEEECYLAVGSEREKVVSTSHNETLPISSSTRSAGSSVSRKARKHLSERWQMACQSNAEISTPTDTRTLGEMLELPDRDATKVITHKILSDPNANRDNVQEVPACPLCISSKDGWKTGIYCEDGSRGGTSRNFPRSRSLPASSTTGAKLPGRKQSAPSSNLPILKDILNAPTDEYGNGHARKRSPIRKTKQKNGRAIFQVGKENMLPEKEIHVTSEKARHSICISDLSRSSNIYNEHPDDVISTAHHQTSDSTVLHDEQNSKGQIGWTEQKLTTSLPETKEDMSIHNQDNIALKEERSQSPEIGIAEVDRQAIQSAHIVSSDNCESSSPTASLQESSGEETAYSGIFRSINDGIQELRSQLKMLKMDDQADTCRDHSDMFSRDMFSSDECNDMDISNYQVMEEQLPIFKDEEDRDFTYVQDMLGTVCDFPVYPEDWQVSSNVFLWLENKYSKLLLWSKSDRKLLFGVVNSIIADMTAPGSSLHSKIMMKCWPEMDRRMLTENVWKMVLMGRNHQHFALDSVEALPLDHHSELEAIGTEIIEAIQDDILEESLSEIVWQEGYHLSDETLGL